ncbi:hypothetical protein F5X98DRAFT_390342 [Xylaria grammica]|nr:hypothetical protein F5X98DRAFT_390342 [Xylaria grammica]
MSFSIYQKKLSPLFGVGDKHEGQSAGAQANPAPNLTPQARTRKGFADITEIHTQTVGGIDEQVLLTSEYFLQPRAKSERIIRKYDAYSLLVRRVVRDDGRQHVRLCPELYIQSESLCSIVREIIDSTYDSLTISSTPIIFPEPYYELFFKRDEIDRYMRDTTKPEATQKDLKLLYDFMRKEKSIQDTIAEYNKLVPRGKIHYNILWTIFPPNELLYVNDRYIQECWLCRDIRANTRESCYEIEGIRLDYDGRRIGMAKRSYKIYFGKSIGGVMEMSQLPVVPFHFLPIQEQDRIKTRFIARGRSFRDILGKDLLGFACKEYTGPTWENFQKETEEEEEYAGAPDREVSASDISLPCVDTNERKIDERVVADYKSFLEKYSFLTPNIVTARKLKIALPNIRHVSSRADLVNPHSHLDGETYDDTRSLAEDLHKPRKDVFEALLETVQSEYKITEIDDLLVFSPPRIPAYGLKSKRWGWVLIERLEPTRFNVNAFESLQMALATKDLVRALVSGAYSRHADDFDDIIRGKGKGLVMLLHGDPGVGKTLMAESIAELREAPLYSVSGGELSTRVTRVEDRLSEIFKLGKRWNAIVLLDEADVVMAQRSAVEIERNAIVAVWLRMIEYFEGVFFLTTNRHDVLDEAFKSRVNLTIHMPKLDSPQRAKVWENLITNNNTSSEGDIRWTKEMFKELGKLEINGRTIKNILRTAEYFARSKQETLTASHVNEVIKVEMSTNTDAEKVWVEMDKLIEGKSQREVNLTAGCNEDWNCPDMSTDG